MTANGVHIPRVLSADETAEVEKLVACGRYEEAAERFGGRVTHAQDQRDLPPMADAELALHLRGGLVPMSVAYRAASRIEQLVATVEQLEAALTRANAATAAAYEAAAREVECGCGAGPCQDTTNCSAEDAAAIRALATPDQTAALDKLIAEAVKPYVEANGILEDALQEVGDDYPGSNCQSWCQQQVKEARAILAASKKGGQ